MRRLLILGIAGLAALVSCSVKEDRSDCPCYLEVDLSYARAESVQLRGWTSREVFSDAIPAKSFKAFHEYMVPRGQVRVTAIGNTFELVPQGYALTIEEGHQMDSLFACSDLVDTQGEIARNEVLLRKNFATIGIDFKDEDDGRTAYDLLVSGTVFGVDIRTLEPVDGRFRCEPDPVEEGRGYSFRVPRQKDESLKLTLSYAGKPLEVIDLGYLIARSGFDWNSADLGDVSILCDLPAHTFTITVKEWEGPVTFNITI